MQKISILFNILIKGPTVEKSFPQQRLDLKWGRGGGVGCTELSIQNLSALPWGIYQFCHGENYSLEESDFIK